MKWLGAIKDPKDLTTKEYVDKADDNLQKSINKSNAALKELDESKVDVDDMSEYSAAEVTTLWNAAFAK